MTKGNLVAGMLVVTADGKVRVVLPTKADGLVLMSADNKALKVSKLADDLSNGSYRTDKAIVQVYDVMNDVNGHVFDTTNRDLLFDKVTGVDTDYYADDCDDDEDDEEEDDDEDEPPDTTSTLTAAELILEFPTLALAAGMVNVPAWRGIAKYSITFLPANPLRVREN